MPQPFNYSLNLPNPTENLIGSISAAQGINQLKAQKSSQEAAVRDQEAAAAAREQLNSDLNQLGANPNPAALAQVMARHPQMSKQFKEVYDVLDSEQQKSRVSQASQVYAALEAGEPDVARDLLQEQAEGYRNSGMEEEAKALETLVAVTERSPETARTTAGLFLASAMGPEEFTETFTKLQNDRRATQLESATLSEKQSKAYKAAVDANFAESSAASDLQKRGWDIFKIQEDVKVSKENTKIAALNADLRRQQLSVDKSKDNTQRSRNELRRQEMELKLEEMKRKRDATVNQKVAEVETSRGNVDNMLNTLDRVMQTPLNVIENAAGPLDQFLPTARQSTADFEELVSTIDAQAFLAQIPQMKGLGALSDAEGKKLSSALQNFSLRQSPNRLIENAREAQRLLLKARKGLSTRYGVPETIPDTPAVETGAAEIEDLLRRYGG